MARAGGTFEVKVVPRGDQAVDANLGRMTIEKQFHGDLEATSKGEMLTAGTGVKGSAGYVAIERVAGVLQGRSGSFALQHSGTMTRGAPQLAISVVPDSGTDQLAGLAGNMTIEITDGKHSYNFDYTLEGECKSNQAIESTSKEHEQLLVSSGTHSRCRGELLSVYGYFQALRRGRKSY